MHPVVEEKLEELRAICVRYRVRRLDLFGSAATGGFEPERSDLDFLVELAPRAPAEYADTYFDLMEELERLFGRRIDLVTTASVVNPVFWRNIEATREPLYAA
jgi:predicted nucleotidyltransferase